MPPALVMVSSTPWAGPAHRQRRWAPGSCKGVSAVPLGKKAAVLGNKIKNGLHRLHLLAQQQAGDAALGIFENFLGKALFHHTPPLSITTIRLQMVRTTDNSWVMMMMVTPSFLLMLFKAPARFWW